MRKVALNHIHFISRRVGSLTVPECIRTVWRQDGLVGFYKGITASYFGISETIIHFVIYEAIKSKLREMKGRCDDDERYAVDFLEFMGAGAVSKTCATCVAYPHGKCASSSHSITGHKVMVYRWTSVIGVGPSLNQQGVNVSLWMPVLLARL